MVTVKEFDFAKGWNWFVPLENHATSALVNQPTVHSAIVRSSRVCAIAVGVGVTCHVSCVLCHVSKI